MAQYKQVRAKLSPEAIYCNIKLHILAEASKPRQFTLSEEITHKTLNTIISDMQNFIG